MLSLVTAFNEVEENLAVIKEKEDIITSGMNQDNVSLRLQTKGVGRYPGHLYLDGIEQS